MPEGAKTTKRKGAAAAVKVKRPLLEDLDRRPNASDMYLWCDYIELRCLAHPDRRFSRDNLQEILAETTELVAEEFDDVEEDGEFAEQGAVAGEGEPEESGGGVLDMKHEARVADFYANLTFRAEIFGDAYPFELSADARELRGRNLDAPARRLYVRLLLSSSLRLVAKTRWAELTEPFEEISTKLLKLLMPKGWQVHRFGAKGSTRYSGLLAARFKKLAKDIRGTFSLKEADFKTGDHGDGGLDIVAWHPLGEDSREGIPIAFAQCGCTAGEWSMKSLEPHPVAMPYLRTYHPWATYYFMPQDLVKAAGKKLDWQRKAHIKACIVIDRLRIVRLASEYDALSELADDKLVRELGLVQR